VLIGCWAQLPGCRELLRPPLLLLATDADARLRQAGLAFWDDELPRGLAARLTVRLAALLLARRCAALCCAMLPPPACRCLHPAASCGSAGPVALARTPAGAAR
jgi:hypothetical protein